MRLISALFFAGTRSSFTHVSMDGLSFLIWTLSVPLLSHSSLKLPTMWFGNIMKVCFSVSSVTGTLMSDTGGHSHDYVFVTPVEVDSGGSYISHDVVARSRRRRSLVPDLGPLHYRLSMPGRDLHLDLRPSAVLADGFTVHTVGRGGIMTGQASPDLRGCFYQGFIRDHSTSSIAVSTCMGLSGLIRTLDEEFFIAPLPLHLAAEHNYSAPRGHHPHVLYKRSVEHLVHAGSPPHPHHGLQWGKNGQSGRQHFCGRRKKYAPKPPAEGQQATDDEFGGQGRSKRSPIPPSKAGALNVETLVVADRKMVEKHGRENVTTYVLTVMNMVSSLFKDGTIGSDINIVVVSLILLEEDPLGLSINHHADQSLNSFCHWQSGLIGNDGKRHDHAVLLTGLDICSWKNEPCDTLAPNTTEPDDQCSRLFGSGVHKCGPEAPRTGLRNIALVQSKETCKAIYLGRFAPISGMCSRHRSCTINEDTGLGLAFTIAHESGHNFGMIHDGEGNPCRKAEGNIMSPTLAGNNGVFSWSACSRQYLSRFLSTPQASCLADEPKQIGLYKYPDRLPGQLYDADTQCKWQFGPRAKLCNLDFVKDICKSLWCHRAGHRCETKFMPAAEGTDCGPDRWCRRGQCVKFGDGGPRAIHGQWSTWSVWSDCSRSCGGGVMHRERHCNSPRPQYNGKFCVGAGRLHQLCNTKPCPPSGVSFRAQQCAEYNSKPFRGWFYKWKPYTKVEEEDVCKLYCIAEDFDFFFAMSNKVKDGTSCLEHSRGVCIDGICEPVGCDQVLGSRATLDACGICKGDNSTCKFLQGQYLQQHRANEYYPIVTIPAGARSIHVREMEMSTSYLAVRSPKGKYHLTGDWTVDWPGKFWFSGTVFEYQRPFGQSESLYAPGPTNETLVFEILLQGTNPGVMWEYTLPKDEKKPSYTWGMVRSECSAPCAGGRISTKVVCLQDEHNQVSTSLCDPQTKLAITSPLCNTQPCPAHWTTGKWGPCSRSCGGGQQTRPVRCLRKVTYQREEVVLHSLCPVSAPTEVQPCNAVPCPPQWDLGPWSRCSKTCGRGLRRRTVSCRAGDQETGTPVVPDDLCDVHHRPKDQETCVVRRCPKNERLQWVVTPWGECSASCGTASQKRELRCAEKGPQGEYTEFPLRRCRNLPKPILALQQSCSREACPKYGGAPDHSSNIVTLGWYASPWQQCSVSCGGGVQIRSIQCLRHNRLASGCPSHQKPSSSRACNTHFCPAPGPAHRGEQPCVDHFSWCHLVPQHGVCNHKFYGQQCCKSCSNKAR